MSALCGVAAIGAFPAASLPPLVATEAPVAADVLSTPDRIALLQEDWQRERANVRLALVLGGALRETGRNEEAKAVVGESISALRERMETSGDSAEHYELLGLASLFLNDYEAALESYRVGLALNPERAEIHLGLIRALLNMGREAEARDALDLALVLFPESVPFQQQLAELHLRAGRIEEAIPQLEALRRLNPDDAAVRDRLLQAYVETGNAEKARPLLDELAEAGRISPLEGVLHRFRMHLEAEDLRAARVALQEASRIAEDDPRLRQAFGDYYALQARGAEKDRSFRRAVLFWERALEYTPDNWRIRYRIALAHAALNQHDEAMEWYLPLLEQRPVDALFYADFAHTLFELERLDIAELVVALGLRIAAETDDSVAGAQLERMRRRFDDGKPLVRSPFAGGHE